MGLLQAVEEALREESIFSRARTSTKTRALGITLHHLGLSLRDVEAVLDPIEARSREAVREWYGRAQHLFDVEAKDRDCIAVDETVVKLGTDRWYLWAAVDVRTWEVLHVALTQGQSGADAIGVLQGALQACSNDPLVLADRAPWYEVACNRLGLDLRQETFGERNPVEQWFGLLKQRVKRFYRRWPANASRDRMEAWVLGFVALYHVRGEVPLC